MFPIGVYKKYAFLAISLFLFTGGAGLLSTAAAQDNDNDNDSDSGGMQSYLEQLKKRLEAYQTGQNQQAPDGQAEESPVETPARTQDETAAAGQPVRIETGAGMSEPDKQALEPQTDDRIREKPVADTGDDAASHSNRLDAAVELAFWDSIKDSDDATLYESYLDTFPDGVFVEAALAKLQAVSGETDKSALAQEVLADEIDALLAKAWAAYERQALTTPEEDSALKWAKLVYEIDPENAEADKVLASIIDTYLGWSQDKLRLRRLRSASRYLAKGRSLERYANDAQKEEMLVLAAKIKRERRRLANARKRRQKQQDTPAVTSNEPVNTTDDSNWLQRVDKKLQTLGKDLDEKFGNK